MVDKHVFKLIVLFSAALLLTGCLLGGAGGSKQGTVKVIVLSSSELEGAVETLEITLGQKGQTLLYLGHPTDEAVEFQLEPGLWQISGLWRRPSGVPAAVSMPVTVEVSRGKELTMQLLPISLPSDADPVFPMVGGLVGSARNGMVTLTWSPPDLELPVEVYRRKLEDRPWQLVDVAPAGVATFVDENPHLDAKQYYAVRVVDKSLSGPLSEPLKVYVPEPWAILSGSITIDYELPDLSTGVYMPGSLYPQGVPPLSDIELELDWKAEELSVIFPDEVAFGQRELLFARAGLALVDEIPELLAAVGVPVGGTVPNIAVLEEAGCVVEPNSPVVPLGITVNDPYYSVQWNLPVIGLPKAWEVVQGSRQVRIAVIDSGIDVTNPDLAGRIDERTAYSFVSGTNESPLTDKRGHGTHVAGIIGALTNNSEGIAGVMWDVQLVPIKVFSDNGENASISTVANAILYAAGLSEEYPNPEPCHIINLSLGTRADHILLQQAVQRVLNETDVVIVAASGNSGETPVFFPAAYEGVIAVGSVVYGNRELFRADYSNYGYGLDLVAPGGDGYNPIWSTVYESYGAMWGTSMAAPHVSGVAGLMLAAGIDPREIPGILLRSAVDLGPPGWDQDFGYGLLNANWAVRGIDSVQVIVGDRIGNKLIEKAQTEVLIGESLTGLKVPYGEYQVFTWIDLGEPGIIDEGDYLFESEPILFEEGARVALNMVLRPVKRDQ